MCNPSMRGISRITSVLGMRQRAKGLLRRLARWLVASITGPVLTIDRGTQTACHGSDEIKGKEPRPIASNDFSQRPGTSECLLEYAATPLAEELAMEDLRTTFAPAHELDELQTTSASSSMKVMASAGTLACDLGEMTLCDDAGRDTSNILCAWGLALASNESSPGVVEDDTTDIASTDDEAMPESGSAGFDDGTTMNEAESDDADEAPAARAYDWRDDEEPIAKYRPGGFHPVCVDQVYNNRYRVRRKLGSGAYSTVWLVRDLKEGVFRAMKVLAADSYGEEEHIFEIEILNHLRTADPNHKGYSYINHLLDQFEHEGPNGTHVCLVFEAMGMSLQGYAEYLQTEYGFGPVLPDYAVASITKQLLMALSYAHENGVIHTDIKLDNIFVRFSSDMKLKIEEGFLPDTYELVDYVEPNEPYRVMRSMPMYCYWADGLDQTLDVQVCLGDWGVASWTDHHLCEMVQPDAMRAPEVFLRAGWDESVDLWSLGPTLLRLLNDEVMVITETADDNGNVGYSEPFILMQMQELFGGGRFPASLLERGHPKYVESMFNEKGRVTDYDDEEPASFREGRWTENIPESFRKDVTDWFEFLMKLDPRDRPSIQQLLDHPWLSTERQKPRLDDSPEEEDEDEGEEPLAQREKV